ncbi:MAG: 4Fe-4S dicluster domain-containing protein [Candidatus Bathyarchaeia archaeon]
MKTLLIDSGKCTGCKMCVEACSLTKAAAFKPASSRIHIAKLESRGLSVPIVCEHCVEAPCEAICPVKAITTDPETGWVNIHLDKCTGCKLCKWVCPFGADTITVTGKSAYKCDLCGGDPECVKFCTPGALLWTDVDETVKRRKWAVADVRARELISFEIREAGAR